MTANQEVLGVKKIISMSLNGASADDIVKKVKELNISDAGKIIACTVHSMVDAYEMLESLCSKSKGELSIYQPNIQKADIADKLRAMHATIECLQNKGGPGNVDAKDVMKYDDPHFKLADNEKTAINLLAMYEVLGERVWDSCLRSTPTVNERLFFYSMYFRHMEHLVPNKIRERLNGQFAHFVVMIAFEILITHRDVFGKLLIEKQNKGKIKYRRKSIELIKKCLANYGKERLQKLAAMRPYTRAGRIEANMAKHGISRIPSQKTIVRNWPTVWEEIAQERGIPIPK